MLTWRRAGLAVLAALGVGLLLGRGCPPASKKVTDHESVSGGGVTEITPERNADGNVALDGAGKPIYKTVYKTVYVKVKDHELVEKRSGASLGVALSPFTLDKAIYGGADLFQAGPGDVHGLMFYQVPSPSLPGGNLYLGLDYKILF